MPQVTLEEAMICNTLQTLNEEAFEDVVCSERPSPSPTLGQQQQPGEMQQPQPPLPQLAPIRESAESGTLQDHHQHGTQAHATHTMHAINQQSSPQTQTPHKHSNGTAANIHHYNQQQPSSHNSFAHNFAFDVDPSSSSVAAHGNKVDPLPTVIVIPSSTVDDTPL